MNLFTTKVLVDKKSPFLKSVILNKGFNSGLKKGMPVLEWSLFCRSHNRSKLFIFKSLINQ